jgi:SAM-dependent methyltransferase
MLETDRRGPRGNLHTKAHASRSLDQVPFVLPYLRPGMRLLDSGCGPGPITLGLAATVAPGHVIGVDLDPERIEMARAAAAREGCANVTFEVANIYDLPFPDSTFDAVFQKSVFIHLPDPTSAAKELFRVLKPSGLLASSEPDHDLLLDGGASPEMIEFVDAWHEWQRWRGSNHFFGKHLYATLGQAGFERRLLSCRMELKYGEEWAARPSGRDWLDEPEWLAFCKQQGKADESTFERWHSAREQWKARPDSFGQLGYYEVICRKPD